MKKTIKIISKEYSTSAQFFQNENYEKYYELSLQTEEWISFVPVG